jgi:conjugal transfer pilus assembly protein TraD
VSRPPYWAILAFAAAMSVPFGWAVRALVAVIAAQITLAIARSVRTDGAARAERELAGPGVVLGRDERGKPVHLADRQLAAHGLIVGASGAGKSTTLLSILTDRIARGMPVVAIDLKGSPAFSDELQRAATAAGRRLIVWTLDGPAHWNPLAHGNATELKDKLVSTERFTEPHYQRAAERYVQTALNVLEASGQRPRLADVVAAMEPKRLAAMTRALDRPSAGQVLDYVANLAPDQLSAVRGLASRLALLTESTAGRYLAPGTPEVDLRAALDGYDPRAAPQGRDVVLFSLNSSVYGKLAAQIGTLVIQDLVSATGHRLAGHAGSQSPAFTQPTGGAAQATAPRALATVAVDEFSALGADHLLALLARGREPGVSVLLATQELADLDRAGRGFRDQVLGLTAVKIAHRQDVPASAQLIAQMAGTEQAWEVTRQIRAPLSARPGASLGTRREVERFIVHPNEIKTLATGHAVMLTKIPRAQVTRVGIAEPTTRRPLNRESRPPRAPGIDQPAPGVTR